MDVLERNYKFYFNIYESCGPSETSAAMFVCTQTFCGIRKRFTNGAEPPAPFVEKLLPKVPFKW